MKETAKLEKKPRVSIIIPTYNRSAILSHCLDSLFSQTYPHDQYEIIVINDGSNDDTEPVLREFEKKAPCSFLWTTQENHGRSHARNVGISNAHGDLICFTDDDCVAEENWIKNLIAGFNCGTIGAIGGKIVSYRTNTPIQQFIEDSGSVDQEIFLKRNTLITGNAAYRKDVLEKIGGFDPHLIACEDLDLSIKTQESGYSLRYEPGAVVYHDHPATVKGFFSQQHRNGIGFVQLHRKYGQRFSLPYNTSIYCGKIFVVLLGYPLTLVSALLGRKKKYSIQKPLFSVIYTSAFLSGVIRETLWGKEYLKNPVQPRINSRGFMEDRPVYYLLQNIMEKIRKKP